MDAAQLSEIFRNRLGIRVQDASSEYVRRWVEASRSAGAQASPLPVMGADARTGKAVRRLVSLDELDAPGRHAGRVPPTNL